MIGSSLDFLTTQYVVLQVELYFVQSFLRHRVTSQRNNLIIEEKDDSDEDENDDEDEDEDGNKDE